MIRRQSQWGIPGIFLGMLSVATLSLALSGSAAAQTPDSAAGKTPERVIQEKPEAGETLRQRHIYPDGSQMLLICNESGQVEYRVFRNYGYPHSKKVLFPLGNIKLEESYGGWQGDRLDSLHERRADGTTWKQGKRLSTGTFELREFGADGKTLRTLTRQLADGNDEVTVYRKDGTTVESWTKSKRATASGAALESKQFARDGKLQAHTEWSANGSRTVSVYSAGALSHKLFYGPFDGTLKATPLVKLEEFGADEKLVRQVMFDYLNNQGAPQVVQAHDWSGGKKTAARWYHVSGGLLVEETFDADGKTVDLKTHNPPENRAEQVDAGKLAEPRLDSDW